MCENHGYMRFEGRPVDVRGTLAARLGLIDTRRADTRRVPGLSGTVRAATAQTIGSVPAPIAPQERKAVPAPVVEPVKAVEPPKAQVPSVAKPVPAKSAPVTYHAEPRPQPRQTQPVQGSDTVRRRDRDGVFHTSIGDGERVCIDGKWITKRRSNI